MIESGSLAWMNWHAHQQGAAIGEGYEFILFSDSLISGLGDYHNFGPYKFTNALSGILQTQPRPGLVLEVDLHLGEFPDIAPPPLRPALGSKTWVGLSIDEEIAALISLILGGRFRSSGASRRWEPEFPQGRPWFFDYRTPVLPDAKMHRHQRMFPELPEVAIDANQIAHFLPLLPRLNADHAVALTRSAREYSNALWIAESEPELAWRLSRSP